MTAHTTKGCLYKFTARASVAIWAAKLCHRITTEEHAGARYSTSGHFTSRLSVSGKRIVVEMGLTARQFTGADITVHTRAKIDAWVLLNTQ